ncbi:MULTISPECIES: hypothetical protein [unclassified Streptomyces]|uniref:hypothetical protein n=1 Tax=unclassified Streptomyces TaxID=2593676 RepID=UPI0018FE5DA7|nr:MULTISPECIES: hypothetical protein [unclassified Streptomyces]MBT2429955.1 hypothetical protein [Streptomyces sp. ISL-112]MBT2462102.1 hypothetical protein [Streptomyces sp. ISL-63]
MQLLFRDVRGSRIPGGRATVGGGIVGVIALILGLLFGIGPEQLGERVDSPRRSQKR